MATSLLLSHYFQWDFWFVYVVDIPGTLLPPPPSLFLPLLLQVLSPLSLLFCYNFPSPLSLPCSLPTTFVFSLLVHVCSHPPHPGCSCLWSVHLVSFPLPFFVTPFPHLISHISLYFFLWLRKHFLLITTPIIMITHYSALICLWYCNLTAKGT